MISDKKYNIIYADPPWKYRCWSGKGTARAAENHYETMNFQDIKSLPINTISENDCILFLWATFPNMLEAFEVIKAWGFTYKTVAFTWIKTNKKSPGIFTGLGYWTRANAEICLLATKGHPKRIDKSIKQIIMSPRREHSRKPDEVRENIIKLMGDIPRIELFARERFPGWDAWGIETDLFNNES